MKDPEIDAGVRDAAYILGLQAHTRLGQFQGLRMVVQRIGDILDVRISDLLVGAPREVITDLVLTVFSRMAGVERQYSTDTVDYLYGGMLHQRFKFIARKTGLTASPEGKYKNLRDSYNRLVSAGLVEEVPDIAMVWTVPPTQIACGTCNALRMLWVSGRLDNPAVPDECVDATVYTLLQDIRREAFTENEADRYKRLMEAEQRFPQYKEIMDEAWSYINNSK